MLIHKKRIEEGEQGVSPSKIVTTKKTEFGQNYTFQIQKDHLTLNLNVTLEE